jgi:hypothetical protein
MKLAHSLKTFAIYGLKLFTPFLLRLEGSLADKPVLISLGHPLTWQEGLSIQKEHKYKWRTHQTFKVKSLGQVFFYFFHKKKKSSSLIISSVNM